jgi:hypothetical protein
MFKFFLGIINHIFQILFLFITNPNKVFFFIRKKKEAILNAQLNELLKRQDYILANLPKTNRQFYNSKKNITQIEHQVGRYLNCKNIVDEINNENIPGDILEFGSWQGLSLMIFSLIFGNTDRKFVGVDSFEGLPETSTIWTKGDFNNTSYNLALQNILTNSPNKNQYKLIKGWFNQKSTQDSIYSNINDLCLIHFDADLGTSTTHALNIIEHYLKNRIKPIFFCFDDWGCHQDEVPESFLSWLPNASLTYKFQAQKVSTTRFTRYYKIIFN